jgi:PIN domain nuclease of toxin-antitoxin system
MIPVLLDSCTWIWLASDQARLSAAALEAISSAQARRAAHLSVISCWEVAKLVEKGKLSFKIPVGEWVKRALSLEGINLQGLTPRICIDSTELPGAFHGDPADQIIVATARQLGVALVTPDRKLRQYNHVPTVW